MVLKSLLAIAFLMVIIISSEAQKMKVKRKGVTPIDVSKNTGNTKNLQATLPTYSLRQLTGKWQEVGRIKSNTNSPVDFNDSLFYTFSGKGEVYSRDGVNMSLMGEALIEPGNVLVAGADVFTIKSLNNQEVILDDGEYLHRMVRKSNFWHETLPTTSVSPEKFINPVSINAAALAGKWKVYRRAAPPGTANKVLIRLLNVREVKNNTTASGEIMFYKTEKLETLPCTITLNGEKMQISTEKNSWNVNVYKADGRELIFGDATIMYYCKPL